MNGRMDAGAIEADWRSTYAGCLGNGNLSVTAVSPEVHVDDGRRVVVPGGSLECILSFAGKGGSMFSADFEITGSGVLDFYIDGDIVGSYSSGRRQVRFPPTSESVSVKVEYRPSSGDAGTAFLYSMRQVTGTVVLFR
jgi:hypothetical protein